MSKSVKMQASNNATGNKSYNDSSRKDSRKASQNLRSLKRNRHNVWVSND